MSSVRDLVLRCLPFAADPALEVCIVGSLALAEACARSGISERPVTRDIDLAWRLSVPEALRVLKNAGLEVTQTKGALDRGTIGVRTPGQRFEITSFRGGGSDPELRLAQDALRRDMTIGAILWRLHDDSIHDPLGGLEDWKHGIIRACGDAGERLAEHAIRALRYVRRGAELGFALDERTRKAIRTHAETVCESLTPEAVAEELRRVLAGHSPGLFFALASEEGLLEQLMPEVSPLFDGRAAGRIRWHPEMSQGLHTVLTLRAAAMLAERDRLDDAARLRLLLGVLCHDLGKGRTRPGELPSHPGHDMAGTPLIDSLFDRFPGLGDRRARRFCHVVARTHVLLLRLDELRVGTLVDLWEREFSPIRDDLPLLAAAVRADHDGRLAPEWIGLRRRTNDQDVGWQLERRVLRSLQRLDGILREVRGDEVAERFADEPQKIRAALHELRCRAIHAADPRNDAT
ncbi:MAG: hypothetical protein KDC95_01390 [Planctomycetes bacterium]|nr:hypothetical protein [Planctomycetota bacterium]